MSMTRRKLLDSLISVAGIGAICSIVYPVSRFLIPPEVTEPKVTKMKIGSIIEFENNSSRIIKFGRTPIIVIRKSNGEFKAFEATCTHLDCIVQYKGESQQIICACHNGIYDLTGKNVSGPPPKPLNEYSVKIIEDEVIVMS